MKSTGPEKNILFHALALLPLLAASCGDDQPPQPQPQPEQKKLCTFEVILESEEGDTVKFDTVFVQYVCDELVVRNPSLDLEHYLDSLGYEPVKNCHCNPDLQIWKDINSQVDPIGVVEDPPPSNNEGSMSLNVVMPRTIIDDSLIKVNFDSLILEQPEFAGKTVIVGMVDTGIDFEVDPGYLWPFLWNGRSKGCCKKTDSAKHGLDMIDFGSPMDQQGHGSHCSGIIAGYGELFSNGFSGVPLPVAEARIEIVTAKISEDSRNTMTLFDATCGIHYVLKQGAKVVNLSWGFLENGKPVAGGASPYYPHIMVDAIEEAGEKGAVIVTSAGNNKQIIQGDLKFWPACFALEYDHVISVEGTVAANNPILDITYSNRIPGSLRAPGTNIISSVPRIIIKSNTQNGPMVAHTTTGLGMGTGTSMSAAFITRYVALMYGKREPAPGESVKAYLQGRGAGATFNPKDWLSAW